MRWRLSLFLRDIAGVAAVEMALIAPVIAGLTLVSYQVWDSSARIEDMRTALRAGGDYYMNGGVNDTTARTIALSAWENAPADADVNVSRACYCGTDTQICNVQCNSGSLPAVFVTLAASATRPNAPFSSTLSDQTVVRVR